MVTPQEKSFCVLQFEKCKSIVQVQCEFHCQFNENPPRHKQIYEWHKNFTEKALVLVVLTVSAYYLKIIFKASPIKNYVECICVSYRLF
uniref:Uncharacterized protein n=1 Tax=Octopus bimaculoides TaxID=37653 RepID=A0A0L8H4M7_OCTBM